MDAARQLDWDSVLWAIGCGIGCGGLTWIMLTAPSGLVARPRRRIGDVWRESQQRVENRLARVGFPSQRVRLGQLLTLWIGAAILVAVAAAPRSPGPVWPVLFGTATLIAPALLLQRVTANSRAAIEKAAIESIAALRDSLGGGVSIEHACIGLGRNGPEPLRRDWQRLERDLSGSVPFSEALRGFAEHVADPTIDMVVAALIFNDARGGGQIRAVLSRLGRAATARRAIEEQRRANQAKTVAQARVLVAAAPIMLTIMTLLDRDYLLAFASPLGQVLLAAAILLIVAAYWLMLRLGQTASQRRILIARRGNEGTFGTSLAVGILLPQYFVLDLDIMIWIVGFGLALFAFLSTLRLGSARSDLADEILRLERGGDWAGENPIESAEREGLAGLASIMVAAIDRRAARLLSHLELGRGEDRARQLALVWPDVTLARFAGRRILCALGFALMPPLLNILRLAPSGGWPLWACLLASAVGFAWPHQRLARALAARRAAIVRELPLIADLLILAVSAGENLEGSLRQVGREAGGVLGGELRRLARILDSGTSSLNGALAALAARNGVRELDTLVDHLRESERIGHGLLETLGEIGDGFRTAERNQLLADAGRAEVRMLLPMAGLLFPVILILVFYPATLQLFGTFSPR